MIPGTPRTEPPMPETSSRIVVARDLGERWLALLEAGRVTELVVRPLAEGRLLGAIFLGRVVRAVPGVAGAFVDVGLGRDAFLPVPEGDLPREGEDVLVQVTREADAGKGPRVTRDITLPGWRLVLAPRVTHRGISRKIVSEAERERLRGILERIAPEGLGVIARTAAAGAGEEDLRGELDELVARWASIVDRAARARAPLPLHEEEDPARAFVRDQGGRDVDEVVVEPGDEDLFAGTAGEERLPPVRVHRGPLPAIEAYGLDRALDEVFSPEVPLPGGGRLVIQATEAMVAVDVNSGRDVSGASLEETALRTNLEAAEELGRQLRLRELGGLVVADFIDMQRGASRRALAARLEEVFARDRARIRWAPPAEFTLVRISRQRRRPPLERLLGEPCRCCGRSIVPGAAARARRLLRRLRALARPTRGGAWRITAPADVLEEARAIATAHGEASGLPPIGALSFRVGGEDVVRVDGA